MVEHKLPKMPYAYDALEPHLDAQTMEIHHTKHHQAYTNGLNDAWEDMSEENQDQGVIKILADLDQVKPEIRGKINFHGGGYVNHEMFWKSMAPGAGGKPDGNIAKSIDKSFGSFDKFKEEFSNKTATIQGSGWGWLVYNPKSKNVEYKAMENQDNPVIEQLVPLLGLDVWEHAYYLKYQNKRPDYIAAWWNVVDWQEINSRFSRAESFAKALFSSW
ncbi:superoxide dismutase [Nitrosopumilus sp. b1]|uniref:superoxide dismutase n=1 Tax=Nitrosopumilus sp. b1 TaxID=2109907 RepID=UPI000E2D2BBC|nr:superoxide dismutase [Nitrosopumilus sp. b1]RDJ32298.1 MAG: superoxide dismutase [Thermoproteota archaeon]KAF6243484.1 superoxide dismutase [Nitrosopumilus sp. b1]RDJ33210.1 MAG: superoxide dismutase [Thermoproteota archaeon]RDJ36287.1 MAG: superoxide dismutase [Thermoproteota archaeon]RDJ38916.1 MAG: superoxide dismutase [Thermoproteota archaeon]